MIQHCFDVPTGASLIPLEGHEAVLCHHNDEFCLFDKTGLVYSLIIPRHAIITCGWWKEDGKVLLLGDEAGSLHVYREDVHYHSVKIAEDRVKSIQVMMPQAWILTDSAVYSLDDIDRCLWGVETAGLIQHLEMNTESTDLAITEKYILVSGQGPMLKWQTKRVSDRRSSLFETLRSTITLLTRVPVCMDDIWRDHHRSIANLYHSPPFVLANDPDRGRIILLDSRLEMAPIWQWRGLRGQQVAWLKYPHFACWSPRAGSLEIWDATTRKLVSQSELGLPFTLLPNGLLLLDNLSLYTISS